MGTRGKIRETSDAEALDRARSMVARPLPRPGGLPPHPIRYRLSRHNGGKDPDADSPADWSPDWQLWTCDCSGFVAWALGYDRKQPAFPFSGGWLNTDSIIMAARSGGSWFELLDGPSPGALMIRPGVRRNGRRIRVGHVGIVSKVLQPWSGDNFGDLRVIHCSSTMSRKRKAAVQETDGGTFRKGGSVFVRYLMGGHPVCEPA